MKEFIEKTLHGRHHRFKRGYKNVINEAIRLNNEGIDCPLAIETSGHAAMRENYFLDDGAYLCTKIIIKAALLRKEGKTKAQAMKHVRMASRDNARQPIDWGEYILQESDEKSVLNFYRKITNLWHNDPVLVNGSFRVRKITKKGVIDFERSYQREIYRVHIDLSGKTKSYCKNTKDETIIANH